MYQTASSTLSKRVTHIVTNAWRSGSHHKFYLSSTLSALVSPESDIIYSMMDIFFTDFKVSQTYMKRKLQFPNIWIVSTLKMQFFRLNSLYGFFSYQTPPVALVFESAMHCNRIRLTVHCPSVIFNSYNLTDSKKGYVTVSLHNLPVSNPHCYLLW